MNQEKLDDLIMDALKAEASGLDGQWGAARKASGKDSG